MATTASITVETEQTRRCREAAEAKRREREATPTAEDWDYYFATRRPGI